ncbi:hypothetical protein AQJ23_01075 [Streptomyces antibioticus]|nr:hypothetical protein AQJ23_01075 [Streptomyces antibioticus]
MSDSVGYLKGPDRVTQSDGITLLGETGGKHGMPDSARLHDHAGQPVKVSPPREADAHHTARARVRTNAASAEAGTRHYGTGAAQRPFRGVSQIANTPIVVNVSRGLFASRAIRTLRDDCVALVGEGIAPASVEQTATQAVTRLRCSR